MGACFSASSKGSKEKYADAESASSEAASIANPRGSGDTPGVSGQDIAAHKESSRDACREGEGYTCACRSCS